jgi:hypothetical protein
MQPVRKALQPLQLPLIQPRIVLGVVTDEHLREVRVELQDVLGEVVAVLEVELVLPRFLDRHRQDQAVLLGLGRDRRAELLIDENAGCARLRAALDGRHHPLEDQPLGVGDGLGLLRGRIACDPEHLLLKRPSVIEREDVQPAVVSKGHEALPFVCISSPAV